MRMNVIYPSDPAADCDLVMSYAAARYLLQENLPVELPYDEGGKPIDFSIPGNPLDRHPTWRDCAARCSRRAQ